MKSAQRPRATAWQLKTRTMTFDGMPAIMGIVNVTPDSFSDGGKFYTPSQAVDHALRLEDAGADVLDIGGESTRPYSDAVETAEELRRVLPVIEAVRDRVQIPISIDTSKAAVAAAAIERGAEIINDVTGLEGDPEMLPLAVQSRVGVCAMHMQGRPPTMQDQPTYTDVTAEIYQYLEQRDQALLAAGIEPGRICLDPGIGFGKTHAHNIELLQVAARFLDLGRPILIGHSRKAFLGKLIGDMQADRLAANVGVSLAMADKGIQLVRVHDVQAVHDAFRCYQACHPAP